NGHAMQCNNRLRGLTHNRRSFQRNPPRLPIRLYTVTVKLTAYLYQVIANAVFLQMACDQINAVTLGDTGKIHVQTARLLDSAVMHQSTPPSATCLGLCDLDLCRGSGARLIWAKAPQADQRTHSRIENAF